MTKKTYQEIYVEVERLCITDVLRTSSDNMDGFDNENWGQCGYENLTKEKIVRSDLFVVFTIRAGVWVRLSKLRSSRRDARGQP